MGIDMSYVAEQFTNFAVENRAGASDAPFELDPDEVNKNLKRRD